MKKIDLQACYVPQMKAENMYNSYSGIKNRIFKEKKTFFLKFLIFQKFWKNSFSWKILKFLEKFQKWPPQDFSNIARNKVTKNQPIQGIQQRLTYDNQQGRWSIRLPPYKIGLKRKNWGDFKQIHSQIGRNFQFLKKMVVRNFQPSCRSTFTISLM